MTTTIKDPLYLEALEATTTFGDPPVGIARIIAYKQTKDQVEAILKQNNVILELLVRNSQKIEKIEEEIKKILTEKGKVDLREDLKTAVDELTQKVGAIKISETAPQPRLNKVYFHEDPREKLNKALKEAGGKR